MLKYNCSFSQVSKNVPDPEEDEPLVWEYLWNDPLPSEHTPLLEEVEEDGGLAAEARAGAREGFVDNWRRGTGHMFSDRALDDFLRRNGLSHVIRAHEVKQAGFQVGILLCLRRKTDVVMNFVCRLGSAQPASPYRVFFIQVLRRHQRSRLRPGRQQETEADTARYVGVKQSEKVYDFSEQFV